MGETSAETRAKQRASHVGKPSLRKGVKMPEGYVSPRVGSKHSSETREKMRAAQAGKPRPWRVGMKHSDESKAKMSASRIGKPGPWRGKKRPEAAVWLSAANRGRPAWNVGVPMTEPAKAKLSKSKLGKPLLQSPKMLAAREISYAKMVSSKRKRVRCLTDGLLFDSAKAAADHYGLNPRSLAAVASGTRRVKSLKGLCFKYEKG